MIHLITAVGGTIDTLEQMLQHYRAAGIESFFVNLNLKDEQDPAREQVEAITRRFGCGIASVEVGNWRLMLQLQYLKQREQYPTDWFVLADQDEFQVYPAPIPDVIAECGRWDYVRGCVIDRVARDGGFPEFAAGQPVWEQLPMGAMLTPVLLQADPRQVVAVRGPIALKGGNHHALEGRGCPTRDYYVPVHHFKWFAGVVERLKARAADFYREGFEEWGESARVVKYLELTGGRIQMEDPNLGIGECTPEYPHWERLKKMALSAPVVL